MKTFISLVKINLNVYFGISALKYRFTREKKRLWEPIVLLLSIILGGGTLVVLYSLLLLGVFIGGQAIGHPEIVLTLSFMTSQLMILFFGIFYIMSVFYFSKDMNILLPLPLKASEVLGAKFIVVLVSEYLIALPMLIPGLVIYGTGSWAGILYWLKGLILILTVPILPLAIAAIFVILLMRFVNLRNSKDLLVVIGSLFGLSLGLGINLIAQNLPEGNEEEFIKNLIESNSGLIDAIGKRFPPSLWATRGLSSPDFRGWAYFFLFLGVSAAFLALLVWLGNHFFYKGYLSGQESRRKNKVISIEDMAKGTSKSSAPIIALFWREWRLFIRTPIYAMNGLAGMIILPIFMFMPLMTKGEELQELMVYVRDPEYASIVVLIALGVMIFASSMNMISCTSISREGPTFWISKMIPVLPRDQILAKLLHSTCISFIGLILMAIPLYFVLHIAPIRLLLLTLLALLANGLINILGLMVDILRPKLEWNDPQEAMKQNLNVFFSLLLSWIVIGVLGVISVILILSNIPEAWVYSILAIVIIILAVPSLYGLFALGQKQYRKLEA